MNLGNLLTLLSLITTIKYRDNTFTFYYAPLDSFLHTQKRKMGIIRQISRRTMQKSEFAQFLTIWCKSCQNLVFCGINNLPCCWRVFFSTFGLKFTLSFDSSILVALEHLFRVCKRGCFCAVMVLSVNYAVNFGINLFSQCESCRRLKYILWPSKQ